PTPGSHRAPTHRGDTAMIDSTDSTEATSPGPLPGRPGPRPRLAGLRARGATAAVTLGLVAGGVAGGFVVSQAATNSSSSSTATGTSGAGGSTGTTPAAPG